MSEKIFTPFDKQVPVILSKKRILGAFAGKRCIIPESKVLTLDGVKEFQNISFSDRLLSFDQMANQFSMKKSSASFLKTKEIVYRVIHNQGEFFVSGNHRFFLKDHGYQSLLETIPLLSSCRNVKDVALISHPLTISDMSLLMCHLNDLYLNYTVLDFQNHYGMDTRQYDQQFHEALKFYRVLFPSLSDVLKFYLLYDHEASLCEDAQVHKRLIYSRFYQHNVQNSNSDDLGLLGYLFYSFSLDREKIDTFLQFLHVNQQSLQFLGKLLCHLKVILFDKFCRDLLCLPPCENAILAIEAVSTKYVWDVSVEGTNNYFSEGAIHHNSGKTEVGAIKAGIFQEEKPNIKYKGIDPYIGVIAAPTREMLDRLSWKKFLLYWREFIIYEKSTPHTMFWHDHIPYENESIIYGISADNPERIEGLKVAWLWADEIFQMKEQFFLECLARVSDMEGFIICTGSLGIQHINPKSHWAYKYFKENAIEDTDCFEWSTADNPYYPKGELDRLSKTLDKKTFDAMFTITWDVTSRSAVYDEFSESNEIENYQYNENLETYISIDWGWTHPMAVGFYQYDRKKDFVYKFDEIVKSKLTLDQLYQEIIKRNWIKTVKDISFIKMPDGTMQTFHFDRIVNVKEFCCDIAGDQTREQMGVSNILYMQDRYKINFKRSKSLIIEGIATVRSYIKNAVGNSRFFVDKKNCPEFISGVKRYRYPEKDGIIISEAPIKENDDAMDETRYFFVNYLSDRVLTTVTKSRQW